VFVSVETKESSCFTIVCFDMLNLGRKFPRSQIRDYCSNINVRKPILWRKLVYQKNSLVESLFRVSGIPAICRGGGLRLVMELFGILEGGIRQRCVYGGEGEMYEECGGWREGTELLWIMMQIC
jgi:hypothetical protein